MDNCKTLACVTGASGMVGQRIIQRLLESGYSVRALSRKKKFRQEGIEHFHGSLEDDSILISFVSEAHLIFHCAAEFRDESKMWNVNVLGTQRLLNFVRRSSISYLCYLSSAGVVGKTMHRWVDEKTDCNPQSVYERSKWAAEQLVARGIDGCRIVILRPTNVIDDIKPGALKLPMNGSWFSWLKIFIKGGECAHIVHADDVAAAAMYFVSHPTSIPQCFFVSCDHETLNTFAGLWALYKAAENNRPLNNVTPVPHLPLIVPYILRRLWRGKGNRGDVRYSSKKIISKGFNFPHGLQGAVESIFFSIGASS